MQQFPYFNQNKQFNQQGELDKLQTHNRAQELASVGGQQQLNYHDVHSYSNQLEQNDSNNDQLLNQHGEFEKREILNQTQMSTGEPKETNYNGMLSHPNQLQLIKHPLPINQQGELENFRQLQLHKSAGEHQQLSYQDVLNYLNQLQQQQYYRNHHQQQFGNFNQPPFQNSAGERHHIKYNDNHIYPSHDQQPNQQGEILSTCLFLFELHFLLSILYFYALILFDMPYFCFSINIFVLILKINNPLWLNNYNLKKY